MIFVLEINEWKTLLQDKYNINKDNIGRIINSPNNVPKSEIFEESATKILEFLSEIEAGETAIDYINSYIYKRIKFHANNKPRKLTGLFVDEFAPLKTKDYSAEKAVILFNLGGPDKLESVEPFLFNLFNDPAILNLPSFIRYPLAKLVSKARA